jgi:DivIVA domain-containing protein
MGHLLLFVVVALVVAAIVFGVTVMVSGDDSGLTPVEPDGRALPLPSDRPLGEEDVIRARFDTALRGYRMSQVDQALQRAAYDIGYKGELIGVLEAEVAALREGRTADADVLRRAREAAVAPPPATAGPLDETAAADPSGYPDAAPASAYTDAAPASAYPDAAPASVYPDATPASYRPEAAGYGDTASVPYPADGPAAAVAEEPRSRVAEAAPADGTTSPDGPAGSRTGEAAPAGVEAQDQEPVERR